MNEESIETSKAPLIDHFIELRTRILRSIFILSITFIFPIVNFLNLKIENYTQIINVQSSF